MSFDDEWSQIKAEQTRTHLNQLDGGGGSGSGSGGEETPDLKTSAGDKKAAAEAIRQTLCPDTAKAGDHADAATTAARTAFGGWQTASALKTFDETWSGQVKLLLGRLAGEASALSGAGLLFQRQDLAVRDAYQQLLGGQGRS
ncbi:hypothetical protein ACIQF5_35535 [Streptomyces goshikiensis]|uniref:hypothetical protein n=1 Tax=Streptomyces goshikiensis TaxID=1942 RepID=UPI0037FC9C5F